MAYFWTEVDIDVEDFLESCSRKEKEELIKILKEGDLWENTVSSNLSVLEQEWNDVLTKLAKSRLRLSNEDEELIKKIANKY